jgi:hypothetical protein
LNKNSASVRFLLRQEGVYISVSLASGLLHLPALVALHAKPVNDAAVPVLAIIGGMRAGIFACIDLLIVFGAQKNRFLPHYMFTSNLTVVNVEHPDEIGPHAATVPRVHDAKGD